MTTDALKGAFLAGDASSEIWGLTTATWWTRMMARHNVPVLEELSEITEADRVLLLRLDHIFEDRLIAELIQSEDALFQSGDNVVAAVVSGQQAAVARDFLAGSDASMEVPQSLSALPCQEITEYIGQYDPALRHIIPPYVINLAATARADAEDIMFKSSYKGVTDIITGYVWPRPAKAVTSLAANLGLTPNLITTVGFFLMLLAFWCFWQGQFMAGLLSGFAMTFLDTVDGKLARVTIQSSRWGHVFDHGMDLIHPPFWWYAWWHGLTVTGSQIDANILQLSMYVVLGGYLLGRIIEGIFILCHGMDCHVWRPVDSFFRLITARRNPNLVILLIFASLGFPGLAFVALAAWTAVSIIFHVQQLLWSWIYRLRGRAIVAWLESA